jgi:leishmanolysin-like peptidase
MNSYEYPYFYSHATGMPRTARDEWNRPPEVEALCVDGTRRLVPLASVDTVAETTNANGYVAYEIVTETVRNVVRNQFDCRSVEGARLEVCVAFSLTI